MFAYTGNEKKSKTENQKGPRVALSTFNRSLQGFPKLSPTLAKQKERKRRPLFTLFTPTVQAETKKKPPSSFPSLPFSLDQHFSKK